MKHMVALMFAFMALVSIFVIFLVSDKELNQPPQFLPYTVHEAQLIESSNNGISSFFPPLVIADSSLAKRAVSDNDLDNDGNLDGIADPSVVVGPLSPLAGTNSRASVSVLDQDLDHDGNPDGLTDPLVVVEVLPVLAALVSGRLFLALCEPQKLSSILPLVLERPG